MANETSWGDRPYVIVAALAFDETGEAALSEAARVAAAPGRELHVVHVIHEGAHATTRGELNALEKHLNEATAGLRRLLEKQSTQERVVCHVRVGNIATSIVQTAVDLTADLLVVGSHQRNTVAQLLLGSIAKEVVAHAHCPVLIAIPKNYSGVTASEVIAPPCPECVATRKATKGETFWCTRHQHSYHRPHIYSPSESGRPVSVMPGGH
jgi:nucleotide-binding universal stress UspA family protein